MTCHIDSFLQASVELGFSKIGVLPFNDTMIPFQRVCSQKHVIMLGYQKGANLLPKKSYPAIKNVMAKKDRKKTNPGWETAKRILVHAIKCS